jgi:predicted phosphodiesterase
MKIGTTTLIPQNKAPSSVKNLAIFNGDTKVCDIPLGVLEMPNMGTKLYSFGAISDIHLQYDTAQADFQRALTYFNETEDVAFTCVCGDLTQTCYADTMATYKEYVDTYSPNTPVYEIAGNHESYAQDWTQNGESVVRNLMETYTRKQLHYSFTKGNDVFIMVGVCSDSADFGTGGLQWLYETLEENRNKRCFVFQHIRPDDSCGNAYGIYKNDIWNGTQSVVFENLLKHYRNVIFFHGHSHLKFELQTKDNLANYDNKYGMHSIHISSLAAPRTGNLDGTGRTELYAESEGYVVDVYPKHIVLRGRNFVTEEFIPVAQYCLETKLVEIEANTFTDSTGTITK